jgi:hypothetical protein
LGAKAERTFENPADAAAETQALHRDTPPEDEYLA